ncbi:MAG: hypothetical protein Q8Q05_01375 [bacterium]|nr:hypothetical protein [bacterium]
MGLTFRFGGKMAMYLFLKRLLGNEDPMVEVVRTELAYAKSVESYCFEHLSVEKSETERRYLNNTISRVASLRQQAKTIKRQDRSWGVLRRLYDKETFATVGLQNVEAIEKFLADSSKLRQCFWSFVQ